MKRVNECIMCLKVLIGDKLVTYICAYAPQTGRSAEKDSGRGMVGFMLQLLEVAKFV